MEELTQVTGIGPWTAEMVLMFSLGRTDIFSKGDLILKRQIMEIYGIKKGAGTAHERKIDKKIDAIIKNWSPWKTYAAKILWRTKDAAAKK
jgi:DNA-3-methyladenine glycosylase II